MIPKIFAKIFLFALSTVFVLSTNTSFVSAQIASQNCNPTALLRVEGSQSGTTQLIIKPADSAKVEIDVKFGGGFGTSIQSDCTGKGSFYIATNPPSTRFLIPINKNGVYEVPIPKTIGIYKVIFELSDPPDFADNHVYITKELSVEVAKDVLNPTGNYNGNGTGTGTGTGTSNTNNVDPGLANPKIDTDVGVKFIDLDENLGVFFNPLEAESVPELIAIIIRILFVLAGIIAVIVIIIAGFRMVVDSGNETQVKKAKEAITWAVIGLIVSILAFSIVAIIQRIIQS